MATWWTHSGAEYWPTPDEFEKAKTNFYEQIGKNGYHIAAKAGEEYDLLQITVYRRDGGGHLYVDLWSGDSQVAEMFVRSENADRFFFTDFTALAVAAAQTRAAESQSATSKALITFVRHGHGLATVSSDGLTSRDDRDQSREPSRS
jgi:hypothetical protein